MLNNKRLTIFTLITILTAGTLWAGAPADTASLLKRAEAAFKEGNELLSYDPEAAEDAYRISVEYYNSILKSGTVNAGLYYNKGNAFVRLNEPGKAILNYRKALLFASNDHQIKYNLDYARSLQKNSFTESTGNEVLHILLFWHYLIPPFWKVLILLTANFVLWASLILKRFGRPAGRTAVAALIVFVIMGASFISDLRNSKVMHGVVTAESTIGRLGDSRSYEAAFDAPLYEGLEFTVSQRRVGWILAELPNGELVWIEEADCGIIEEQVNSLR